MNALPLDFYDEVIHRLSKSDIERLKLCSGYWSSTAEIHFNSRRELRVVLKSNSEGTKMGLKLYIGAKAVPFELDFKYDRIQFVNFIQQPMDETVNETLENFRTKTLPMIRSIASDCRLCVLGNINWDIPHTYIHPHKLCDIIFDELKEWRGLSGISVDNYGEKCHELIRRQMEFGNLKQLCLSRNTTWPADFQDLVKVFVTSTKYCELSLMHSNLRVDFDMITCAIDRFFSGELTALHIMAHISFPVKYLKSVHLQDAAITEMRSSDGMTAVWELPQQRKKLCLAVCENQDILVIIHATQKSK